MNQSTSRYPLETVEEAAATITREACASPAPRSLQNILDNAAPADNQTLRLRFNFTTNCWQVWNYLSGSKKYPRDWRWFSISSEQARAYAGARVAISVEETVA